MRTLVRRVALDCGALPEDIADIAMMLLSAKSMTGQIARADIGRTL